MKSLVLCATVALLCALSGCATLAKVVTPAAQPFVQAAVDVAVATAVQKGVSATEIKAVVQEALLIDNGESVTITALQTFILGKVASMGLPPGDIAAMQILTDALSLAVQGELTSVTSGAVGPATQVAVATVLNDALTATAAYGA